MISTDIKTQLLHLATGALATLQDAKRALPRREAVAQSIVLGLDPGNILTHSLPRELRKTKSFQELIDFIFKDDILLKLLVFDESDPNFRESDAINAAVFRVYIEVLMMRIIFRADIATLGRKEEPVSFLERFISFLDSEYINRKVHIPLFHVSLSEDLYDLGDFGTLQRMKLDASDVPREILETESVPQCKLVISIKTRCFAHATDFPLANLLKTRIGLLRLVMHPLISYNHFNVEHAEPWELGIDESQFFGRHWSRPASQDVGLRSHLITKEDIRQVRDLRKSYEHMDWDRLTPWRLAMDRLDDAAFKLECASPDAILDLVIGFENVFVEADGRQESTHKVAIRVSRYLEELLPQRQELFRKMKRIYRSRSTLAHGQRWKLEKESVVQVEEAAYLLAKALRRMVESNRTNIDHQTLELS